MRPPRVVLLALGLAIAPPLLEENARGQSAYTARASSETAQYADTDHVFVTTPSIHASVAKPASGWSLEGSYLVDVVSAASVDIVSTASRRWHEVRQGGALDATYKPGTFGATVSGAVSDEPDYVSWAAGILLSQDLLEKNLTLFAGYDHAHDVAGRAGTPFSVFSHSIQTDGVKAGASLVLDRATVATAMLDAVFVNGDTSEPYRFVPLFTPGTVVPLGASIDTVNATRLQQRVLEQLPLTRNRYALSLRLAHRFASSTLRVDTRLYDDTWHLLANTTDARYLVDLGPRWELGPHGRVNAQNAVSFWHRAYTLAPGLQYPALRTGDRELGPLVDLTGGGGVSYGLGSSQNPKKWVLGFDLEATYTRYLDDLYLLSRTSILGALSIAGEL